VHRFACEEIHGPQPTLKHLAAHSCGRGRDGCVNPKHLRWATPLENSADRMLHGTWGYRLTQDEIIQIRNLYPLESLRKIAKRFNVSQTHIHRIVNSVSWSWLETATG
jgi:hypothetical protein